MHSMSITAPSTLRRLQTLVLNWYAVHGRRFVWRQDDINTSKHPNPYHVLVSEVMLQQTQTSRVQEKLPIFLEQFPTLQALAQADNASVIKAWKGMGYNNRALRLRDAARMALERFGGTLPKTIEELRSLPGIGTYTAAAIAAFAYHQNVAVIDVNIRRVYSRLLQQMPTTLALCSEQEINSAAERIFPRGKSSAWHQAIMDIGALFCTSRAPKCRQCPVEPLCLSAGAMREEKPIKRNEPSFRGTPNRLWRGRVVEYLRSIEANALISIHELARALMIDDMFSAQTTTDVRRWFEALLRALERDRIIEIVRSSSVDVMQDADNEVLFVRLAR